MDLEQARAEFAPTGTYLNTATMGLPPASALAALQRTLDRWRDGVLDGPSFDGTVARARRLFARLVGVPESWVAIGHQASPFVGLVATTVPDGAEVLTVEGEFTSVTFPFAVQAGRGVRVREVTSERLADEITDDTYLVAVAAVQSSDGRVLDLDALTEACAATGTRSLVDLTQAAGWLPVQADRFDWTVTSAYKWLLAPRGSAFLTVRPERLAETTPHSAGWYAGEDPWQSIYGLPLRLAADARRLDVSPAWQVWVGTEATLDLLAAVGADQLHRHALGLADRFREGVGLPPGDSAIVSLTADDEVPGLLVRHRIAAAGRAGRLRLSFHVSNDADDADLAAKVLAGHVRA
jgi:selenocysteine lyase/cysteine desulfurase